MEASGTTGVLRPEAFHGARTRVARLLRVGGPFTAVDVDAKAIAFRGKGDPQVRLSDVSRVRHATGRRWSRLTITTKDGLHRSIGGLPRETAGRVVLACKATRLEELLAEVRHLDGSTYLRASRFQTLATIPASERELLSRAIHDSLVDPSWRQEAAALARLARDPERFRGSANERYRKSERPLARESLNATLPFELNASQVEAAITAEDCTLVLAGPGTGKTATVLAKLAHLRGRRAIPAAEILILAYNRRAQGELAERIESAGLDADVRTFHAFGLDVVRQGAGKFNVSTMAEDQAKLHSALRGFLHDALADPKTAARVQAALHSGMLPYRSRFSFESEGEYYRYVRSVELRTLSGDLVKSFEELEIANFLYCNSVNFRYEEQFRFEPGARDRIRYLPDFFLPDQGIYIEHFGINRDESTPPFIDGPKYREGMKWKRVVHREHGTTLLETYSYQKREGTLLTDLAANLRRHRVELRPIPPEKLWKCLEEMGHMNRLIDLLGTFLKHFKSNGFDIGELRAKAVDHADPERCAVFLDLFKVIFDRYQKALAEEGAIDFEDMIVAARERVKEKSYRSPYRFILVDEFQDISVGRARFLKALAGQRGAELFLVGDDWQSIYRFAGSDPQIMIDCEIHFGATARTALDRSYRLNSSVLSVSTAFVTQNPDQLKKSIRPVKTVAEPRVSISYAKDEAALPGLLQAIREEWTGERRATVRILGRYRHLRPAALARIRSEFRDLELDFMTVHAAKGLEADYIVVPGLSDETYGFPAQIAGDPMLDLVLPANEHFEHAEERRLFYVALTRAREHVYLIADRERPSVFAKELTEGKAGNPRSAVSVIGSPPPEPDCPGCHAGFVRRQTAGRTGDPFFGCSNFPNCEWTSSACDICGDGYIDALRCCSNCECPAIWDACPVCGDGVLLRRKGRNGPFFGCSRWREIPPCRYTRTPVGSR